MILQILWSFVFNKFIMRTVCNVSTIFFFFILHFVNFCFAFNFCRFRCLSFYCPVSIFVIFTYIGLYIFFSWWRWHGLWCLVTFMSNMLYACSILYKSRLPLVVAMNKTDIVSHAFAEEWMRDWTVFEDSLSSQQSSYSANLARSMSLALGQ